MILPSPEDLLDSRQPLEGIEISFEPSTSEAGLAEESPRERGFPCLAASGRQTQGPGTSGRPSLSEGPSPRVAAELEIPETPNRSSSAYEDWAARGPAESEAATRERGTAGGCVGCRVKVCNAPFCQATPSYAVAGSISAAKCHICRGTRSLVVLPCS